MEGALRILIVRLSHIGDAVLTVPLAYQIRQQWPAAYLAWVAEPVVAKLIRNVPALNEVIDVPRHWLKRVGAWSQLRRTMRSRRFDVTIDPQSLLKSSALAWLSGARRRIGFDGAHGREVSRWLNNILVQPRHSHLVDRSLELLRPLGIDAPANPRFDIPIDAAARSSVAQFVKGLGGRPFVVMNPGAGWPSRRWPPDRFGQVARWFDRELGWRSVVVWAGHEECRMAEIAVRASGGVAVMAPPTNLQELMALLSMSQLYFGGDTGPMHLANAVGTVCVGLYGPTRPQDSGAYGSHHLAIVRTSVTPSLGHVDGIQVDEVCACLDRYFASRRKVG